MNLRFSFITINDSQYIVEANRLSDDAFEFCHIYKNMHNRLAQKENRDFKEEKEEKRRITFYTYACTERT